METVSAPAPPGEPDLPRQRPDLSLRGETAPTVIWKPEGRSKAAAISGVPMMTALRRGCTGFCPACGQGRVFAGFLRVNPLCGHCAAPLGEIRADDAPPYFTVFIVAHLVIGMLVLCERTLTLSIAAEMMLFLPATLLATLALMRPVKGATIGVMWKLGLAGETADHAKVLPDA
jgi:uncharacterized protein (DUF983 family)